MKVQVQVYFIHTHSKVHEYNDSSMLYWVLQKKSGQWPKEQSFWVDHYHSAVTDGRQFHLQN